MAASSYLLNLLLSNAWYLFPSALILYAFSIVSYRRFFHPLSNIPGPLLPAVTTLYQTFYNKRFYLQIEKLHNRYGPVVRINPDEIHIAGDADVHDQIYHVGSKYYKSPAFYNALNAPFSSFGAISNEVHRLRRGAMGPMFSRGKVLELESIVQDKAAKVVELMRAGQASKKPVDLHHAFRAVSIDVASEYSFGVCYNFLEADDLGATFCAMARGTISVMWPFQQWPALQRLAMKAPDWMASYFSGSLAYVLKLQNECVAQIEDVKKRMVGNKSLGRQTIFTTLLTGEDKPAGYKVMDTMQIKDEAFSILLAAADTTGNAMTVATFNVLYDQKIYRKLAAELEVKFPDPAGELSFTVLEKLPYLTAVIKEGLRLSFGVVGRVPRIVPSSGATFHGHFVPAGTAVGMSAWVMHRDPSVFPNPMRFDPERWFQGPDESRRLANNMVPFGRGSRQCVGMPLAYSELYVTLGTLFRTFPKGLSVEKNTTPEIMQDYDDFFASYHRYEDREKWFKACLEI